MMNPAIRGDDDQSTAISATFSYSSQAGGVPFSARGSAAFTKKS
jgi:hypothetical protein